jgi:hypothetical protein
VCGDKWGMNRVWDPSLWGMLPPRILVPWGEGRWHYLQARVSLFILYDNVITRA